MKALGYTKDQAPGAISPYLPDFIAEDIADVDFVRLKELGVTHLMLDLDGTLRKAYSRRLEAEVIEVFRELERRKLFKVIAIASNNNLRLQKFAKPIGARVFQPYWHNTRLIRKPHPLYFSHVMNELGIGPSQAVMIGDRLRSDIVGANRAGIRTVLIKQRGSGYWFDHILLSKLRERRHYQKALSARRLHMPSTLHYLRDALEAAGLPSKHIARITTATRSTSYVAHDDKQKVFVKLVSRQHTSANKLYKLWRQLTFRPIDKRLAYRSPAEIIEHEARIHAGALAARVKTPKVHQLIDMGDGRYALVLEYIESTALSELPKEQVTDTLLRKAWEQAAQLHKANITHGDLRTSNVLTKNSHVWLINFDQANDIPDDHAILQDKLTLLITSAQTVGVERAIKAAGKYITPKDYETVLPLLTEAYLQKTVHVSVKRPLLNDLSKAIKKLS